MTDPALTPKIKALIWEELRVGGVIAGWCSLLGCLELIWFRFLDGEAYLGANAEELVGYVCAIPVLVAALLVLNPNYKGALQGGFSLRILQLPVPTIVPVTIAFVLRISFVVLTTLLTVTLARFVFAFQIGYEVLIPILAFYLIMQSLDWARAYVTGLSSAVALIAIAAIAWYVLRDDLWKIRNVAEDTMRDSQQRPSIYLFRVVLLTFLSYGLSLLTITKARLGRKIGIPEIWEWHHHVNILSAKKLKPFRSPVAAQAWLETRRAFYLMPILTVVMSMGFVIQYWKELPYRDASRYGLSSAYVLPLLALLVAAIAHGAIKGILGPRRPKGIPGYSYLQPLTTQQLANARMISNFTLLFLTLAFSMALHFAVPWTGFVTEYIPEALRLGLVSTREAAWALMSRALLLGLFVWVLMTVSTRLTSSLCFLCVCVPITFHLVGFRGEFASVVTDLSLASIIILSSSGAYIYAWKRGLISARAILFWTGATLLLTWMIHGQAATSLSDTAPSWYWYFSGITISMSVASLAAIPFVATVLDMHKRRHSAMPNSSERIRSSRFRWSETSAPTKRLLIAGSVVMIAGIWLGWPSRPKYESTFRAQGFPATIEELNQFYTAVPDDENIALEYLEIFETIDRMMVKHRMRWNFQTPDESDATYTYQHNLLVVGYARVAPGNPIPDNVLHATNDYWQQVTSQVAPQLIELAKRENPKSRYPINFQNYPNMGQLSYFALIKVARELSLDSLHWALEGDNTRAIESLLAIHALANTLYEMPLVHSITSAHLASQEVNEAVERLCNRLELSDEELQRLIYAIQEQESKFDAALNHGLIGERVIRMADSQIFSYFDNYQTIRARISHKIPISQLTMPVSAERIVTGVRIQKALAHEPILREEHLQILRTDNSQFGKMMFIAPIATIVDSGYVSSEILRSGFWSNLTLTGLAVERYRLAHDKLPESLSLLVPEFLDEVPQDYYGEEGETLKYRSEEDGYVLYSVGRDGKDDKGLKVAPDQRRLDDITFTVAR